MAESSFKNEYPQDVSEMTQAEENTPDPAPMIVENSATIDIPDLGKRKNSSRKGRKNLGPVVWPWPVIGLEPFDYKLVSETKIPSHVVTRSCLVRIQPKGYKDHRPCLDPPCLDAVYLREIRPDLIPVMVEKDARSYLPVMNMKKYLVRRDMPIREFVNFIRFNIKLSRKKPIVVCFKNTKPPTGALMSAIDEENKDEDGFLHITYSGKGIQENSRSMCFTLDECSYKNTYPQGMTQAETNPTPVRTSQNQICLVPSRSQAIMFDSPDIEENLNWSWPISYLDNWRSVAEKALRNPGKKRYKGLLTSLDGDYLREARPNFRPVILEKDARSGIPDMVRKKFLVPDDMPLGDFFNHIRFQVKRSRQLVVGAINPIFMFFKNTKPPIDALMSAIYEENKDEDGYLHITYSGEESVCGSNEAQECMLCGRS
ncbi:uncharacterized protein LOC110771359 isoform X1 [Prunus avium]|uniref:Autophagy-related protein n=2 Tax=Prunus avium TaxID=42229 RepID=A0A6P5TV86_PRUAV|nr:uncharacterized protein LOC110771359 isoform X1 [Prunus avium]